MPSSKQLAAVSESPRIDAVTIEAVVVEVDATKPARELRLEPFGIALRHGTADAFAAAADTPPYEVEVVVFVCPHDAVAGGPAPAVAALLQAARRCGLGVCCYFETTTATVRDWLAAGADSVAFGDGGPALSSIGIFTAHNAAVIRRHLTQRLTDLELKLEETRLVNHAKSLIAEQLKISESEALKRLRKESRDQRRPMAQLARVIIEAHGILNGKLGQPATTRVPQGADGLSGE